jgi:hypothetical protein
MADRFNKLREKRGILEKQIGVDRSISAQEKLRKLNSKRKRQPPTIE